VIVKVGSSTSTWEVMGEWMTKPVASDRRLGPWFEGEEAIETRGGEGFVTMV
jgi:hypothetical protein